MQGTFRLFSTPQDGDGSLRFTGILFCSADLVAVEVVLCGQELEVPVGYERDEDTDLWLV